MIIFRVGGKVYINEIKKAWLFYWNSVRKESNRRNIIFRIINFFNLVPLTKIGSGKCTLLKSPIALSKQTYKFTKTLQTVTQYY